MHRQVALSRVLSHHLCLLLVIITVKSRTWPFSFPLQHPRHSPSFPLDCLLTALFRVASFLQAALLVSSSPLRDIRLVNNRRALVTNVTQALIPKIPCLIFRILFSLAPNSQLLILATCLWSQSRFKLADCHSPHQPSPTNPQQQQSCPERRCPQHRPPRPTSMARTAPSSSPRCRWPSSCPSPPSSTEQAAAPTQPPASAPCRPCPQHPPRRPTPYNQARPSRRGDARPLLPPPLRDTAGKVITVAVAATVATMPSRCRRRQRDHARSSR